MWQIPAAIAAGTGLANGIFGGDDITEDVNNANKRITGAQDTLKKDYTELINDFDLGMGQFRQESKQKRLQASQDLRSQLMSDSDSYVDSLGPLNETSKARLKTQMRVPALTKLLEFDLGTTETDLSMALSSLMSSIQLGREQIQMNDQGNRAISRNQASLEAYNRNQPNFGERFLRGALGGMQLYGAGKQAFS